MKFLLFSLVCGLIYLFFVGIGKLIERNEKKEKHLKPEILGH